MTLVLGQNANDCEVAPNIPQGNWINGSAGIVKSQVSMSSISGMDITEGVLCRFGAHAEIPFEMAEPPYPYRIKYRHLPPKGTKVGRSQN